MSYWTSPVTFFFIFSFIFISWRLITLQYCSGFAIHCCESAMDLHVFPIPIPPPASFPIPSLWVFPVHQPRALVSCIQPGLLICFTLDNIHVSMLFSLNIPPSPSVSFLLGLPEAWLTPPGKSPCLLASLSEQRLIFIGVVSVFPSGIWASFP